MGIIFRKEKYRYSAMTEDTYKFFTGMLNKKVSRKKFLTLLLWLTALLPFGGYSQAQAASSSDASGQKFNGRPKKGTRGVHDLVVATGDDPYAITVKAVEILGGMEKFVKPGDVVVVKPNIGWDRKPELAGNTNPEVVAALIDLSFKAGARKVNVFDVTCNDPRRCYANSGIRKVAMDHGANVYYPDDWDIVEAHFGYASLLDSWPVLKDAIYCDTFINVPILKHHGLTRLTLSMKNLMGVCGGNRGLIHQDIGEKLVDLTAFINPDLTVIDAYRVLTRNGPTGGRLEDVELKKTVLAGTDPTLADTYAAGLAGVDPNEVPYLANAIARNFGITDVGKADIVSIKV